MTEPNQLWVSMHMYIDIYTNSSGSSWGHSRWFYHISLLRLPSYSRSELMLALIHRINTLDHRINMLDHGVRILVHRVERTGRRHWWHLLAHIFLQTKNHRFVIIYGWNWQLCCNYSVPKELYWVTSYAGSSGSIHTTKPAGWFINFFWLTGTSFPGA